MAGNIGFSEKERFTQYQIIWDKWNKHWKLYIYAIFDFLQALSQNVETLEIVVKINLEYYLTYHVFSNTIVSMFMGCEGCPKSRKENGGLPEQKGFSP